MKTAKSNTRQNAQTSRRGWRPKKTSDHRLAVDIAESIRQHAENGVAKSISDYTSREKIVCMVTALLEESKA